MTKARVPVLAWLLGGTALLIAATVSLLFVHATPSTSAHMQPAGIGEVVHDGRLTFMVTSVETATYLSDPRFPSMTPLKPRGVFLILKMTVTNIGDGHTLFDSTANKLTAAGDTYENDDRAWVNAGNLITELDPGDSLYTAAVFDVPVGSAPESVELHDSFGSAGVVVTL
jgi:hypothetical protein